MMRPSQTGALAAMADRFTDLPYAIGGSALLALRGIDVDPRDIDVVAPSDRLDEMQSVAGDWWRGLVVVEPHPHIQSDWLASLEIDGEMVEVMGGLTLVNDGVRWQLPMRDGGFAEVSGRRVPLAPVGQWVVLYTLYAPDRAASLATVLSRDEVQRTSREVPPGFGIEWPPGNVVA